jgi:hypothetical protein
MSEMDTSPMPAPPPHESSEYSFITTQPDKPKNKILAYVVAGLLITLVVGAAFLLITRVLSYVKLVAYEGTNFKIMVPARHEVIEENGATIFKEKGDDEANAWKVAVYNGQISEEVRAVVPGRAKQAIETELPLFAKTTYKSDSLPTIEKTEQLTFKGKEAIRTTAYFSENNRIVASVTMLAIFSDDSYTYVAVITPVRDKKIAEKTNVIIDSFEQTN